MITIQMPLWMAIIVVVLVVLLILYGLTSDFIVKIIHKRYDLDLKDKDNDNKEEPK